MIITSRYSSVLSRRIIGRGVVQQRNLVARRALLTTATPSYLELYPSVREALEAGRPVVALESTILALGIPYPENIQLSKRLSKIFRDRGVEPATIAIKDGVCRIGLSADEIVELSQSGEQGTAQKCTTRDISLLISKHRNSIPIQDDDEETLPTAWGATTVASTMRLAHAAGISTFVTGGIGGVHRNGEVSMDVSADLTELSRTPVIVVSAGIKSILDIRRTLEVLETLGVPTVGYQTDQFPAFFSAESGVPAPMRLDSATEVANAYLIAQDMGLKHGMLVAVPNYDPAGANVEDAIQAALEEAASLEIRGRDVTPFVLERVAMKTAGDSLRSNMALVEENAKVGAEIATILSELKKERGMNKSRETVAFGTARSIFADEQRPNTADEKIKVKGETPPAPVVILGGVVIDMIAKPLDGQKLILRTSNVAKCLESDGGVARNIAEVLSRLGSTALLYSAVGNDSRGLSLKERLANVERCGFDIPAIESTVTVVEGESTATYLAILEGDGDLHTACADMNVLKHIKAPPEAVLQQAEILVMDANPPIKVMHQAALLADSLDVKVFFEPTSIPKASMVGKDDILMSTITYASPNIDELSAMADGWSTTEDDHDVLFYDDDLSLLKPIAERVIARMNKKEAHLIITCGEKGVLLASRIGKAEVTFHRFPVIKGAVVLNATGAGDTLAGAFIHAILNGKTTIQAVKVGMEAAKMSLSYPNAAISPDLSKLVL